MTDHKPSPRCPYCGGEMKKRVLSDYGMLCFWRCPKCRATSHSANTAEEAYAAAMQRWQEPNRVLTLEEAKERRAVWIETISHGIAPAILFNYKYGPKHRSIIVADFDEVDDNIWFDNAEYGKHWRCWLRKPTQEEREAAPWESP